MSEFLVGDQTLIVLSVPLADRLPRILTLAERDVALLVLKGHSNDEIAAARGTNVRTVANQLGSVYRKLQLRSRAELAALLAKLGEGTGGD